jgi:hypothetical protein
MARSLRNETVLGFHILGQVVNRHDGIDALDDGGEVGNGEQQVRTIAGPKAAGAFA